MTYLKDSVLTTRMVAMLKEIPPVLLDCVLEQTGGQLPGTCLICDGEPFFDGLFPDHEREQLYVYSLCKRCFENPQSPGIVDAYFSRNEPVENEEWPFPFPCGQC